MLFLLLSLLENNRRSRKIKMSFPRALVCSVLALHLGVYLAEANCGSYRGVECHRDEALCVDEDLPCVCLGVGDDNEFIAVCKSEEISNTTAIEPQTEVPQGEPIMHDYAPEQAEELVFLD